MMPELKFGVRKAVRGLRRKSWKTGMLAMFPLFGSLAMLGQGVDTGSPPGRILEEYVKTGILQPDHIRWLRVRGIYEPGYSKDDSGRSVVADRKALSRLRQIGFRLCGFLEWDGFQWKSGNKEHGGRHLPSDLRDAYLRAFQIGQFYGRLVDVWEVGNEPDIGYEDDGAESYSAFFKACSLGLQAGVKSASLDTDPPARIAPAPFGLPPGPYFERAASNGLFDYANALDFHYYGYAEDFLGVYEQFRSALPSATAGNKDAIGKVISHYPVIVSEFGYGMLYKSVRDTNAGRDRQRDWFKVVCQQVEQAKIFAPMAFYLPPYLEGDHLEFGLLRRWTPQADDTYRSVQNEPPAQIRTQWNLPTPALAHINSIGRGMSYAPATISGWKRGESPVVIDFNANDRMSADRVFGGFRLRLGDGASEAGELRVYNFGGSPIRGILRCRSGQNAFQGVIDRELIIQPQGFMGILVKIAPDASTHGAVDTSFTFSPEGPQPESVFETRILPAQARVKPGFIWQASSELIPLNASNQNRLHQRPLASEEPRLKSENGWEASTELTVEPDPQVATKWRFMVGPGIDKNSRLLAEIATPDLMQIDAASMLVLDLRRVAAEPDRMGRSVQICVRGENGNLYSIWPPFPIEQEWSHLVLPLNAFTMAFYGRANLPWRLLENRVISVMLIFRNSAPGDRFEVKTIGVREFARN